MLQLSPQLCNSGVIARNVLGTKNLGDILSERESIAKDMQVTYLQSMLTYQV